MTGERSSKLIGSRKELKYVSEKRNNTVTDPEGHVLIHIITRKIRKRTHHYKGHKVTIYTTNDNQKPSTENS